MWKARMQQPLLLLESSASAAASGKVLRVDQTSHALQVLLVTEIRPFSVASSNFSSLLENLQDFLSFCSLTF